ncbi:MAG: hypothetical protein EPGJADBJ_02472 [Saprospiraceae bacterium]|nr:hypothetical protein [Saprospiraceae bacterium]
MELLRTFTLQERQRLRLFVASPYFSKGENSHQLAALLELCLNAIDKNTDSGLEKAEVYADVFPGEIPVAGKLEKRMSALHRLVMQFLVTDHYFQPENEPDRQLVLAQEFRKRGLASRAGATLNKTRQLLEQAERRNSTYFARNLRLTGQEVEHAVLQPSKLTKILLNQNFEALYLFYQTAKHDLATALSPLMHRFAFQPSALTQHMLDEAPIPPELLPFNPMLYFSSHFIALINRSEPDIDAFNRFVRDLRQQEHLLAPEDIRNCWAMARNLLIHWWNIWKRREFLKICLEIAIENADRGYLNYYGKILPYTLESICNMALELDKPDISYRFMQEYRGKISGEPDDEPFFRYNLAKYYLHTGNPDKALDLLPHSMPDTSCQLNAKALEIKILYEIDSELLPYRIGSLRMFLNRAAPQLYPPERLKVISLFLNFLTRIYRCPPGNAKRAAVIADSIRATPRVTEYYWLLEKAAVRGAAK